MVRRPVAGGRNLISAGAQYRLYVFAGVEAAPDSQRYKDLIRHTTDQVHDDGPLIGRRGDVQKRQLISALRVVAARLCYGVACVNERDEAYPFDHATAVNVETGNYSFR